MSKNPNLPGVSANAGMARLTQVLMIVAGVALVMGGAVLFLMNARINALQQNARDKASRVGSNQQIAERYDATLATYNTVKARAQFLEASVSAKSYVPTLLQQLQTLATQTHLTVDAVRPGVITLPAAKAAAPADTSSSATDAPVKKAPPPPYDTLGIDVDVTGSYADTAAFLYGLTRFPKIISVDGAQIAPGAASTPAPGMAAAGGVPPLSTKLHLTAFVFHDSAAPAAVPGAGPVVPGTTAVAVPDPAPPAHGFLPGSHLVGDAAGHAAASAVGAAKAANAHAEAGIQSL